MPIILRMHQELINWLIPPGASPEAAQQRLEELVTEYPFFSAAHFLRLKLASPLAEAYPQLAQRSALDFSHPMLLQLTLAGHQLLQTDSSDNHNSRIEPLQDPSQLTPQSLNNWAPASNPSADAEPLATYSVAGNNPSSPQPENELVNPPVVDFIEPALDDANENSKNELPSTNAPAPLSASIPLEFEEVAESSASSAPPVFEPLHTTDYFASVGIRITDQPISNDQLGQQLRRFTDWLKMMKKVHPGQNNLASGVSPAQEQQVIRQAEASNEENEVVTEAMADVLIQQGRLRKAVEVYEKLSLLNPGKSAYFAAKINELKG